MTLVPVYHEMEGKPLSENGRTSEFIVKTYHSAPLNKLGHKLKCLAMVLKFTYPYFSGPLGGVRNLQVTDPTSSTLNVRWEHAEGNPRNYKVFYVPQPGDSEKMVRCDEVTSNGLYEGRSTLCDQISCFCYQELVSGGTTSTVLRNLNANTVYKVTLLPMYENDVEGKRQSENGKTSESRCL